jgi:hypothetical protein
VDGPVAVVVAAGFVAALALAHTRRLPTRLQTYFVDFETVVAPATRHVVPAFVGAADSAGATFNGSTLASSEAPMVAVWQMMHMSRRLRLHRRMTY